MTARRRDSGQEEGQAVRRIRVVRIITRLNVGGPARQVAVHLRELAGFGVDQLLVYGSPDEGEGSLLDTVEQGANGGSARLIRIPELVRPIRPFADLVAFLKIVRILRRERPDVVHTHLFKAGLLGRLAAWLCRVPVRVHTYHGTVFRGHFGGLASMIARWVEVALAKISTRLIALSPSQARALAEDDRIASGTKIVTISPGFDLDRFDGTRVDREAIRDELETPADSPVVVLLGRLAPVKNVRSGLRVLAEVVESVPEVHVWIAGDGPERRRVEADCDRLGLLWRVRFLGFRKDPERVLGGADLLFLPSKSEGLPVAVIEAMTAECVVVATDVGGLKDLVESEVNGILAPVGDEGAMGRAIVELLQSPSRREEMVARAKERLGERFSPKKTGRAHWELYKELL